MILVEFEVGVRCIISEVIHAVDICELKGEAEIEVGHDSTVTSEE